MKVWHAGGSRWCSTCASHDCPKTDGAGYYAIDAPTPDPAEVPAQVPGNEGV